MCYNLEEMCYTPEEILAVIYVSIFNSHDFFIQINSSNWNHQLLALFLEQKRFQSRI